MNNLFDLIDRVVLVTSGIIAAVALDRFRHRAG
jgi:hypothetical protein